VTTEPAPFGTGRFGDYGDYVVYAPPGAASGPETMRLADAVVVSSVYGDLAFLSRYDIHNCTMTRLRPGVGRPLLCKSNTVYTLFHFFKRDTYIAVYESGVWRLLDAGKWVER